MSWNGDTIPLGPPTGQTMGCHGTEIQYHWGHLQGKQWDVVERRYNTTGATYRANNGMSWNGDTIPLGPPTGQTMECRGTEIQYYWCHLQGKQWDVVERRYNTTGATYRANNGMSWNGDTIPLGPPTGQTMGCHETEIHLVQSNIYNSAQSSLI